MARSRFLAPILHAPVLPASETLRLTGYTGYLPATAFDPIQCSAAAAQEPAPHVEPGDENGQLQLRSLAYLHVVELDAARSHSAIIVMKTRPILAVFQVIHGLTAPAGSPRIAPSKQREVASYD